MIWRTVLHVHSSFQVLFLKWLFHTKKGHLWSLSWHHVTHSSDSNCDFFLEPQGFYYSILVLCRDRRLTSLLCTYVTAMVYFPSALSASALQLWQPYKCLFVCFFRNLLGWIGHKLLIESTNKSKYAAAFLSLSYTITKTINIFNAP